MPGRVYQVTLYATPTLIAWYSPHRSRLRLRNDSGTTIYHSIDASVSTTTGASLATNNERSWDKAHGDTMNRPWWGIGNAGGLVVSVEESFEA